MINNLRAPVTVVVAGLFILVAAQSALADPVTYTTTGIFNNIPASSGCSGNGTNQLTCNDGRQITFVTPASPHAFGTFLYTNISPSSIFGPLIPAGITFTLTINQLTPTPGTGAFVGTFVIETNPSASLNVLIFDRQELTIEGITYITGSFAVPGANLGGGIRPPPPPPIPEPATMLLLGTGLAGVVGAVRKRRKAIG